MTQGFLNMASLKELEECLGVSAAGENTNLVALPNLDIKVESWCPVVTVNRPDELQILQWGFVLFWMPGSNIANRTINAAVETVFIKTAFKEAAEKRRCLIPVTGFYESKIEDGKHSKYGIEHKDKQLLMVAGIWEQFPDSKGNSINTFLPLTHESNDFMKKFNRRMPFILSSGYEKLWLNIDYETEDLLEVIEPIYHDILVAKV